jgi:hypothetical protein
VGQICVGSLLAGWYDGHQPLEEGTQVHCVDIAFDFVALLFFLGSFGLLCNTDFGNGFYQGELGFLG